MAGRFWEKLGKKKVVLPWPFLCAKLIASKSAERDGQGAGGAPFAFLDARARR